MTLQESFSEILFKPTPEALWGFKEALNMANYSDDSSLMVITDKFYGFLTELLARSTAREFSHFASLLDMAAVAGVAVENLISGREEPDFWQRFGIAAISETMMVMAARQYVKAWEVEMKASYDAAIWFLGQEFWKLSIELQPDMSADQRRHLAKELISPMHSPDVPGVAKAGAIVRLFQLLLAIRYLLIFQQS